MDIFEKIKNFVASHKKVSIVVLVLTLVSTICIRSYVVSINKQTVNTEKVTETAKKDSTVKKDDTKKSDEKKSDTKKDEKKSDVNENKTTTDTTVAEDSKTVENKTTENTSTNVTNNTSSNTVAQPTSTPCIPTYTTINHPEQGHYETHVVQEAWDDPQFEERVVGISSGHIYNSANDFIKNGDLYGDGNYALRQVQVGSIHHDAVTTQVWVVDQAAWTETVASGC
ncbi:MAG: hypothetical protein HXL60_02640 [Solobacterium sp.]|nr:hypothetical protein [Solobacterium sp.]